jgi:cell division protein YceG involved in septum cleavage
MKQRANPIKNFYTKQWVQVSIGVLGSFLLIAIIAGCFFVYTGRQIAKRVVITTEPLAQLVVEEKIGPEFPVSVNPALKEIIENPVVEAFYYENIAVKEEGKNTKTSWLTKVMGRLALSNTFQNLASASNRILVILPGERKEQVAQNFAKILGWNSAQKSDFLVRIEGEEPKLTEGKFYPGTYVVERKAPPEKVAPLILEQFNTQIVNRYTEGVSQQVPLNQALTLASLLEREAYDFTDMRHISGVIWNRLFIDMKLQIDATLQYAKGSKVTEAWWPRVRPSDKYIASVYNTYKYKGLPPAPIANPSLEAVLAALNPIKTDCMYYFHDKNAGFHCSKTYEEHVALLKQYYGQGK